jgi:Arc/MetJ-type ribon-helix-helix transcriptional regulator
MCEAGKRRKTSMITLQLDKDLESFIQDAIKTGSYATENDVVSDALMRLRDALNTRIRPSDEPTELSVSGPGKKLTKQLFHRHLVNIGLLDQRAQAGVGNSEGLIDEQGEIVDEVVIRERLIEWLTGFL